MAPDESKPDGLSMTRKSFSFHLSPKLHWSLISGRWRRRRVGKQANGGPRSGVSQDRCVSRKSNHSASGRVCGAVCGRPGAAMARVSAVCVSASHTLVRTPLALFTPPSAMGARCGRGWPLSGSFEIRSKTPHLKPPFFLSPADVT